MARPPKPPGWHPRYFDPIVLKMPPIYRAPVFGQWARRIGQVENILALPCTDDPWLWIEGFFYNVPQLLWSFVGPDLNDSYFNRVGRKHGGKRGFTFNVEGSIEGEATDVELPGYGKWLFRLGELAQRLGFWFMVVDATTNFLVNWTSTVYQWAGCRVGQGKFVKALAGDQFIDPFGFTSRVLWSGTVEGDASLMIPGNVGVFHPDGLAGGVGFSLITSQWDLAGPPTGNVTAWIVSSSGETIASTGEITPDAHGNGVGSAFAMRTRPTFSGEQYQVFCRGSDGWANIRGSAIWFSEGPSHAFDPGFGQSTKPVELPWANPSSR